jgi:Signal transduction histidine kinase
MFKSVRLKLTFINIAVVGVILIVFFSGIYVLMQQQMKRQSDQFLFSLLGESRSHPQRRIPPELRNWASGFYAKIDGDSKIVDKSLNLPVNESELTDLVNKTGLQGRDRGILAYNSENFRYLRTYSPETNQVTIVFMNMQPEKKVLGLLKVILGSISLGGLLIVFVSSLFLADKALIPIKKSWERQRNFVADASHELRSPLAVIQTSLELVMGNSEESVESQMKWLENIKAENKRMTKLVDDLLLLARADSDQKMIEKRFFPIQAVVENVIALYEPTAAAKGITLTSNLNFQSDFYGDESRIKQLVIILLDNAIKYTPDCGEVHLTLGFFDNHMELAVRDTGVGIAEEHLEKIFERFYRIDKARSRESGGTGLGLSIADWIVREHKGSINVSSTPGKGTTFKVSLPNVLPKTNSLN